MLVPCDWKQGEHLFPLYIPVIFWIPVNTIIMFCDNKSDSLAYIFSINKYYWPLT